MAVNVSVTCNIGGGFILADFQNGTFLLDLLVKHFPSNPQRVFDWFAPQELADLALEEDRARGGVW